jgi:hypothetical protein
MVNYNSKNSTFTRNIEDDKTVKIELTKRKREYLFIYEEINFFKMPNKFEPKALSQLILVL